MHCLFRETGRNKKIVYNQLSQQGSFDKHESQLFQHADFPSSDHTHGIDIKSLCSSHSTNTGNCLSFADFPTSASNHSYDKISTSYPVCSLIPMFGALHVSLNAQENVFNIYTIHSMKYRYGSIFRNIKLAERPKPWRRTLLLEIIYGGCTLIRSAVIFAYGNCRDPVYGVLLNLLDNYIPLSYPYPPPFSNPTNSMTISIQ